MNLSKEDIKAIAEEIVNMKNEVISEGVKLEHDNAWGYHGFAAIKSNYFERMIRIFKRKGIKFDINTAVEHDNPPKSVVEIPDGKTVGDMYDYVMYVGKEYSVVISRDSEAKMYFYIQGPKPDTNESKEVTQKAINAFLEDFEDYIERNPK